MKITEAASLLLMKVVWPTIDVFLDWQFGIQLILGWNYDYQCSEDFAKNHVYYGMISLIPPTLSALFHLHHWYHFEKLENEGHGRLKTLPTALLQVRFKYLLLDIYLANPQV